MKRQITHSPEETETAGLRFGRSLRSGAVIGLNGGLGSGKTCFVRGAAKALGTVDTVNSPTYSLINVYQGTFPVIHVDAYRLKSPEELIGLGFEDYLVMNGICFIEWADRVAGTLPPQIKTVRFTTISETEREILYI